MSQSDDEMDIEQIGTNDGVNKLENTTRARKSMSKQCKRARKDVQDLVRKHGAPFFKAWKFSFFTGFNYSRLHVANHILSMNIVSACYRNIGVVGISKLYMYSLNWVLAFVQNELVQGLVEPGMMDMLKGAEIEPMKATQESQSTEGRDGSNRKVKNCLKSCSLHRFSFSLRWGLINLLIYTCPLGCFIEL